MSKDNYLLTRERIDKIMIEKLNADKVFPDRQIKSVVILGPDKRHPDFYKVDIEFEEAKNES